MNILPIIPNFQKFTAQKNNLNNRQVIQTKMMSSLPCDTVSFSGNAKFLEQRTKEVSFRLASDINQGLQKQTKEFTGLLKKSLKNITESNNNPNNPIMAGTSGIKGRVKSPRSIIEKAISRDLRTKKEITNMGDTVGFRLVLRSASQKDFDSVFQELGKMVKAGNFKVKEIENYRLTRKDSYVSSKTLDKFEKICQSKGQFPSRSGKAIPNGYTAVHLTIELPNGQIAEIQIMGRDLERIKELKDFYYKKRCHKSFDPKYKQIEDLMDEKMKKLDDFQKETLNRYIKDSFIHARELPPRTHKNKDSAKDFLPIPYSLPQELGFANLFKLKEQCDLAAKTVKQK